MSEKDGGPAFPNGGQGQGWFEHGMSQRDWFAGKAIPAVTAVYFDNGFSAETLKSWFGDRIGIRNEEIIARAAYEVADAMLKERESQPCIATARNTATSTPSPRSRT